MSDGNQAMLNAIAAKFATAPRQRCVVHKMDNVLSCIPNKQQDQIKPQLRALFYQKDRQAADQAVAAFIEKYRSVYPSAIECLQRGTYHKPRRRPMKRLVAFPLEEGGSTVIEIDEPETMSHPKLSPDGLCWRMQAILEWYNTRKKSSQRAEVRRRTMSMYARELGTIPEETARVARAACPKGTLAMRLPDTLGELYQDEQFAALYPVEGQPAYAPW